MAEDINFGNEPAPVTPDPVNGAPAVGGEEGDHTFEYQGRQLSKEDILKKLEHGDRHIQQLEEERRADRERLAKLEEAAGSGAKVEELLEALKRKEGEAKPDPAPATPPGESDIESQIESVIQRREAERQAKANWESVTSTLSQAYGEKVNDKVKAVAAENDLTLEEAKAFATSKPKAFLRLFGELKPRTSTPASGGNERPVFSKPNDSKAPSGYGKARTDKEKVSAYLSRLQQVTG